MVFYFYIQLYVLLIKKLRECTPKTRDGKPITYNLLKDYCSVNSKIVALSTAWYNKYGYFVDAQNKKQTLSRDMSWSLLHFKLCIQASLHTDIDFLLQHYSSIQQKGPLYFSLLVKQFVLSNKQSCEALVSLAQSYKVSTNRKEDLIPVIKLLSSAIKSIMAM